MEVRQKPLLGIKPYDKNAKKHPDDQVKLIVNSIKEFGFNQPIVVDKEGVIIVGHGRYLAAHLLGLELVPVLELDIDEEKAKAYRLADNKLNESEWDMELVIGELKDLSLEMVDLTGFDRSLVLDNDDKDDAVPAPPATPRTAHGDVYEIGGHRIVCGDSTKLEDVAKLMNETKADMVFTDPPYNVNYSGSGEKTSEGIMNDNMSEGAFLSFLTDSFHTMRQVVKEGAGLYIFHSDKTQATFEKALKLNGFEIKNQLIWNKPSAGMGMGDYRGKHEPFFYVGVQGYKAQFYGDRTHSTVIDFHESETKLINWAKRQKRLEQEGRMTIWTMKRESTKDYVHPTQKPVELVTYALTNSSKAGDIVLDLFGGSGSTLIACQKTGRSCYAMELDPKYVDVIIQRYVDFVGTTEVVKNGLPEIWDISEKAMAKLQDGDEESEDE